jgi:hypothetical protein
MASVAAAAGSSSTKQDIIRSLFSKRSAEDGSLDETYVAHVKIFEDDAGEGGVKARYLMLASAYDARDRALCMAKETGRLTAGLTVAIDSRSRPVRQVLRPQGQAQLQRHLFERQDVAPRGSSRARGR